MVFLGSQRIWAEESDLKFSRNCARMFRKICVCGRSARERDVRRTLRALVTKRRCSIPAAQTPPPSPTRLLPPRLSAFTTLQRRSYARWKLLLRVGTLEIAVVIIMIIARNPLVLSLHPSRRSHAITRGHRPHPLRVAVAVAAAAH